MKKLLTLMISAIAVAFSGFAIADTIELADGTLLEGDFIGSSNQHWRIAGAAWFVNNSQ